MSVRHASREAYGLLAGSGVLGHQTQTVFDYLSEQNKFRTLRQIEKDTGIQINAVSGRVNWLKNQKYLVEGERTRCPVTGRTVKPVGVMGAVQA